MIPKGTARAFSRQEQKIRWGNFGKGVRKVCETYKSAGMQDVSLRLYEDSRALRIKRDRPVSGISGPVRMV